MENENKKAYSEVIEILKTIDSEKRLEALPMEMLEVLKSKADPEYKPKISAEIPLDEQNLQPETLSILSWIAIKYWKDEINNEENNIINEEKVENILEDKKQDDIEQIKNDLEENEEQESIDKIHLKEHNDNMLPKLFGKNKE